MERACNSRNRQKHELINGVCVGASWHAGVPFGHAFEADAGGVTASFPALASGRPAGTLFAKQASEMSVLNSNFMPAVSIFPARVVSLSHAQSAQM